MLRGNVPRKLFEIGAGRMSELFLILQALGKRRDAGQGFSTDKEGYGVFVRAPKRSHGIKESVTQRVVVI